MPPPQRRRPVAGDPGLALEADTSLGSGRVTQNGHVESFYGRLRDECLNARTLNDVRYTLSVWRREYNTERPHSSLDYRTPHEFRQTVEGSRAMALLPSQTTTINTTENLQL